MVTDFACRYLISAVPGQARYVKAQEEVDDDAAEGRVETSAPEADGRRRKQRGQNKARQFARTDDSIRLCGTVAVYPEFSPKPCTYGDRCNQSHDLRKYLKEGRRADLETFGGKCPVSEAHGRCPVGWKCRFVSSHMEEVELEDGRKELRLIEKAADAVGGDEAAHHSDAAPGVVNVVSNDVKFGLARKKTTLEQSQAYIEWMDKELDQDRKFQAQPRDQQEAGLEEHRAGFVDPPLRPSEKRKIYFGRETPVLAPLTTQGNLPFRRLCVELGCQATYSEMAMTLDLLTGKKPEWALMRAHRSETLPPRFGGGGGGVVQGYDNARDLKFGAQVSASAAPIAIKTAEAMARYLPHLRLIDMNCGCPIDLVFKAGAGSALLDAPSKLERMIRGMNTVSGEVPITAKLRIGIRDGHPTAQRNIERLAFGGERARDRLGAPGCAAITLHGRTREQRYKRPADWGYIAECAALVRSYHRARDGLADTTREPDASTLANTLDGRLYFVGNGDCYSHVDYHGHIDATGVDTVMIGRGALYKPWLFEEIERGQYLDKSASERLGYVERFVRYGLETWGADEIGVGTTRRFLLDYLSFASRYVPIGLLEYLPPSLQDRAPAFRCRNELETLLSSGNVKDWIKIRFVSATNTTTAGSSSHPPSPSPTTMILRVLLRTSFGL